MGVTLSRVEQIGEGSSAVMGNLPANTPWYLLANIGASSASGSSVSVSVTVVGGSVDVYVSLVNPTPSASDYLKKHSIASTTFTFTVELTSSQNAVYMAIVNPAGPLFQVRSGTGPQVSVTWTNGGSGPGPGPGPTPNPGTSSSKSVTASDNDLTGGEIALIVCLLLFALIVSCAGCYWYLVIRRRREEQDKALENDMELRKDDSVIAVETSQLPQEILSEIATSTEDVEAEVIEVADDQPQAEVVVLAPEVEPEPESQQAPQHEPEPEPVDQPEPEIEVDMEQKEEPVAEVNLEEDTPAAGVDDVQPEFENTAASSQPSETVQVSMEDVAAMDSEAAIAVLRNMTPVLGVVAQDVKNGVMIKVVPSNMVDAGLQKRDVITGIDGVSIRNRKELRDIVRSHVVGDLLTLDVSRGSDGSTVRVEWVIQAADSSPELISALRQRKVGNAD
jgi:hypothetical protein